MNFNLDLVSGQLLNSFLTPQFYPVVVPLFSNQPISVQFWSNGATASSGGTVLSFTVKKQGDYAGDARLYTAAFTSRGAGVFTASLIMDSDLIEADFDANPDSLLYFGQFSWLPTGSTVPTLSVPFPLTIQNSYIRGSGGATPSIPAQFSYRPDLTGITGGAGTLESMATLTMNTGFLVALSAGGGLSFYQLQAGAANTGAGDVAPLDYDATANSKKWVKIL